MVSKISREDFKLIVASLKAAYPKEDFISSQHTFNLWYTALQDLDYPTLQKAAMAYIMSNHFPPAISDIRQIAYDLDAPADDLAAEEWARLMKALGHAGSPEAADHWDRLPEVTREIVGGFSEFREWANTPTVNLMSVQRPMFIKRFEEVTRRRRLVGSVPESLRIPERSLAERAPSAIEDKSLRHEGRKTVEAPKDLIAGLKRRLETFAEA